MSLYYSLFMFIVTNPMRKDVVAASICEDVKSYVAVIFPSSQKNKNNIHKFKS